MIDTLGTSGVPLGPLAGRELSVFLEDGVTYHRIHRSPSCSSALEYPLARSVPLVHLVGSRELCAPCLPSVGVLLPPSERTYLEAAVELASAVVSLRTFLDGAHGGWIGAAALSGYLDRLERVDVQGIDDLVEYRTSQSAVGRERLERRLRWLRRQGDTRLLWLYAARWLRPYLGPPLSTLPLSAVEDHLLRLLAYTILPLPERFQPHLLVRLRTAVSSFPTDLRTVAGPVVGVDRELELLFRVAALRWGTTPVEPAVLRVPALVADVLAPVAPTLCGDALPGSTIEVFLTLWDAESDPLPVLEAARALLS